MRAQQKLSDATSGMSGALTDGDFFGVSVAALGALNATHGGPMLAVGTDMDNWNGAGGVLMLPLGTYPLHACAQSCTAALTCAHRHPNS